MSCADQSFTSTAPNTCVPASIGLDTVPGLPEETKPTSSLEGRAALFGRNARRHRHRRRCASRPTAAATGVPDTTTLPARRGSRYRQAPLVRHQWSVGPEDAAHVRGVVQRTSKSTKSPTAHGIKTSTSYRTVCTVSGRAAPARCFRGAARVGSSPAARSPSPR